MDDDIVGFLILCKPCFNDAFIRHILQVIFFFGYARFAPLVGVVKRSEVILFKDVRSIGGHTLSDILHQLIQYFVRIFFRSGIPNHVREESLVIQDSFLRFALADFQRFHFLMVQDSLELASHHRGSQKHTQHPVQNNIH